MATNGPECDGMRTHVCDCPTAVSSYVCVSSVSLACACVCWNVCVCVHHLLIGLLATNKATLTWKDFQLLNQTS